MYRIIGRWKENNNQSFSLYEMEGSMDDIRSYIEQFLDDIQDVAVQIEIDINKI